MRTFVKIFILLVILSTFYGWLKPMPEYTSFSGTEFKVPESSITLLSDITHRDEEGNTLIEQEIFDEIFSLIHEAESYLLVDMFLWNSLLGAATSSYRGLASELVEALVLKAETNPDIIIQVITDPINEIYGGMTSHELDKLREVGIPVVVTNLIPLRDSNPLYSGFWRVTARWFGNSARGGWLPNPFDNDAPSLTLRSYLSLLNFKANHRKVLVADSEVDGRRSLVSVISSANPHDGSSAHTNVAVRVDDKIWQDVVLTEMAVVSFSGYEFIPPPISLINEVVDRDGDMVVQILTEGVIRDRLVSEINQLVAGDRIDMAMFYLSDRHILNAIIKADSRGVVTRLLLDPNKDAFGRQKTGIPNRPVASELLKKTNNLSLRWCNTQGEQCHMKFTLFNKGEESVLVTGSANLTRRNIGDFNLETNILIRGRSEAEVFIDTNSFFERFWNENNGDLYSLTYNYYSDDSIFRWWRYYIMERTGLSTF